MKTDVRQSARERLLAAANELFYADGVQTVGIDRVIEHAGVAKASLYNTFGSKENLVRAYLEGRHEATVDRLRHSVERRSDPRQRLLAVFDAQVEMFAEPSFRGCAFITASAEAPDGGLIEQAADDYRAEIRSLFTDLAREAGAADPAGLGRQLQLLYDGGGLAARMDRDPDVAVAAKAAAEVLLDAAIG
jgi:AcrR family transcriptional regulator